ncbi:MAG: GatB/YqeY domain-containing protein [Desulfobacterales bacterium]|nr:GatB/YqeY domain-containing protein [Desulfobacterales bacterium]
MSLQKSISAELQTSIKNRDGARTAAIRVLIGEFQRQPQKKLEDSQVASIIKKLVKSERELLAVTGQTASEFIEILEGYLPAQASEEEIRAWITAHVDFSTFANKMQAMRPIMNHFDSRVDGNQVKKILQGM